MVLIWFTGMLFTILSGENQHFFMENCHGNISYKDFEACVRESRIKTPLIESVGITSFKKQLHLNSFSVLDIILPFNNSIGVKGDLNNPTFKLNPAYTFSIVFFDRDYFLYVTNPLIVHRSMFQVSSTAGPYILMLGIEVRTSNQVNRCRFSIWPYLIQR